MLPIALSTGFLIAAIGHVTAIQLPGGYDTVWTTQSENSAGSMPLGGGDLGMNVWAESGSIYFYLAQSGAFDENNSLLKLGRVKIGLEPNPFSASASIFEQRLRINDGYVTFSGDYETSLKLWVDMNSSNVHVELDSNTELNMTASFESWRTTGYNLTSPSQQQTSWGLNSVPDFIPVPEQRADTIDFYQGQGVLTYHHNAKTPLFDFQAQQQDLPDADSFFDPMRDNTFGAYMFSPQLQEAGTTTGKYLDTDFTSFNLVSKDASTSFRLYIVTNQQQTADVETWKSGLLGRASTVVSEDHSTTVSWWHDFWDRSYILINPNASSEDAGFQVGKNYQYFRYMMGCNAKGNYPLRFNGGLFTFDPVLTDGSLPFTPDYRKWSGGTFTAQNQRLLYWPLLKTGDWDIIQQEFNFYGNISPNHRKLGRRYFGIDAALTSEQMDNTGLPNVYEYNANEYSGGQQRSDLYPKGIMFNDYLSWVQDTANEFADMVLHYSSVYGKDVSEWMSFVEYQLAWFDEFYQQRNGLNASTGKLIIYPGSGAETYKLALDASSTVSGLSRVITDLLQSGLSYVKGNQTYYENYLARVPSTPLQPCPGNEDLICIAPASNYSYTQNDEPTALYPVFPWSEYGLGQPTNLSYAYNSYFKDQQSAAYHGDNGWRQDQIWFARMGLTDLAKQNTVSRLSDSTQYRFSAFKGPNYDWSPDINHYGSAAIGLQEMILQTFAKNNSQIRLLPAFPADWTGSFKLTAPQKTIIQGDLTGTDIQNLVISPSSRMGDVVWGTNESQVVA